MQAPSSSPNDLDFSDIDNYSPIQLPPTTPLHSRQQSDVAHDPTSSRSSPPRHRRPQVAPRFFTPAVASASARPTTPRAPAARLWNPQNFSPRGLAIPNVPVDLPPSAPAAAAAASTEHNPEQRDEYPLLTLPEQRRSRQSFQSLRAGSSLVVEPESSGERSELASVPLPKGRKGKGRATDYSPPADPSSSDAIREGRVDVMVSHDNMPGRDQELVSPFPVMSKDLEGGPGDHRIRRTPSKVSIPGTLQTGTQNAQQDQAVDFEEEDQFAWGPSHPCFPHLNPHVPLSSPLYSTTRIIRIRRDWMQVGDLAPTFASVYPEVLDEPRVMSEDEFRRVIKHINTELIAAFSPWTLRSIIDAIVGVATGWLWDDLGFTGVKGRLRRLEKWIEAWNQDVGAREGVRIIPLRRTAYMTLDIQIPDPEIPSRPVTRATETAPYLAPHSDNSPYAPQQHHLSPPGAVET